MSFKTNEERRVCETTHSVSILLVRVRELSLLLLMRSSSVMLLMEEVGVDLSVVHAW